MNHQEQTRATSLRPIYIQGAEIATQCGFLSEYKTASGASSAGASGFKAKRRDNNAEIITSIVKAAEAMYKVIVQNNLLSQVRAQAPPIEAARTSNTTNGPANTPSAKATNKKLSALMEDVDNDNFDV
jgi:hypothetical protein